MAQGLRCRLCVGVAIVEHWRRQHGYFRKPRTEQSWPFTAFLQNFYLVTRLRARRSSVVNIVTNLRAVRSGVCIPTGQEFFLFSKSIHPASCSMDKGDDCWEPIGRSLKLTTDFNLVPRLRMRGAMPLLMTFVSWTRKNLTFLVN